MSVKIHNGFRMPGKDLPRLHALMGQLRATIRPLADAGLRRFAVHEMVRQSDEHLLFTPDEPRPAIARTVLDALRDRHKKFKASPFRDPDIDFTFEITFFPAGAWLLGIPCTEKAEFLEELLKLPGVEAYGYWNSTDAPEDVPSRKWRKREKDWGEALKGSCPTLAYNGFTYQIADPSPFFFYNDLTGDLLPTLDQRTKWAADTVAMEEKFQAPEDPNEATSRCIQVMNWLRFDEEGMAYMERLRADLRLRLQEHPVSLKELLGSPGA